MIIKKNIIFLSTHIGSGGAGKAAQRIYESLNKNEFNVKLLEYKNELTRLSFYESLRFRLKLILEKVVRKLFKKTIPSEIFSTSFSGLDSRNLKSLIDLSDGVFLFWVNQNFISLDLIQYILDSGKPVFWRLSDMWPFTGGCHYSFNCTQYKDGCAECPAIQGPFELAKITLKEKRKWNVKNLTVICPSHWIYTKSKESLLFKKANNVVLQTGVDLKIFNPIFSNDGDFRNVNNINFEKLLIGVSSVNLSDYRKGLDLFIESIEKLSDIDKKKVHIVFIGKSNVNLDSSFSYTVTGYVQEDEKLSRLYSSLDIFIAPSREENLANTVIENMACGTPCIAFDIGGMKDVIKNEVNGFLIPPFDTDALTKRITSILSDKFLLRQVSQRAITDISINNSLEKTSTDLNLLLKNALHN